jgi:hypothetical protein
VGDYACATGLEPDPADWQGCEEREVGLVGCGRQGSLGRFVLTIAAGSAHWARREVRAAEAPAPPTFESPSRLHQNLERKWPCLQSALATRLRPPAP